MHELLILIRNHVHLSPGLVRPVFYTQFMMLANDVAVPSPVTNLTSTDLTLDTKGRD